PPPNAAPDATYVFQQDAGIPGAAVTLACPLATIYYGARNGIDPDGPLPGPAFGLGTGLVQWNAYGVPQSWDNVIAGVGAAVNGTSGASPPGCGNPCDASIGLLIPVTLSGGAADGVPTTIDVVITTTYGATTPGGALEGGACPADCGNGDHAVGIVDFLAL